VIERTEPNLLRDDFPYSRIPPIRFELEAVPQSLPADTWITDTTFRDGQQARAPYTVEQTVEMDDLLDRVRRSRLLAVAEGGVGDPGVRRQRLRDGVELEADRRDPAVGEVIAQQVRLGALDHDLL
jgi:hypothetical protein